MEDPKQDNSLNLIDTSSKKSMQDKSESNSRTQIKENNISTNKNLILEERDDDEEDEKNNDIENDLKEDEKLKNLMADLNEEEEEEEEENDNLNYDRHFDRELKVGKDYEYKTIQDAINDAKPNNIIKISPGIYRENLIIKGKTKIDICSLDNNDQAVLLSDNSPCMMISCLEQSDTVQIYNIKFIHRGIREDIMKKSLFETKFFSRYMTHNKESYFIYQFAEEIEKLEINYVLDIKIVENIYEENHGNFCAISILKGTVSLCSKHEIIIQGELSDNKTA